MKAIWRRSLSLLLVFVMIVSMMPTGALALDLDNATAADNTAAVEQDTTPAEDSAEETEEESSDSPSEPESSETPAEETSEEESAEEPAEETSEEETQEEPAEETSEEESVEEPVDETAQLVAEVEARVAALPTEITSEEQAEAVEAELKAIDEIVESDAYPADAYQALDWAKIAATYDALDTWYNTDHSQDELGVTVAAGGTTTLEKLDTVTVEYTELYSDSIATPSLWAAGGIRYRVKDSGSDWTILKLNSETDITLAHGVTYEVQERYTRVFDQQFSSSYYVTFKVYHNVTASVDASANAEGKGSVTATGKVYHKEEATVAVTDVYGYKAELYNGSTLVTTLSDDAGWTYTIEEATESVAYTVKYVSEAATEYDVSVKVVNGEWGTATLGTNKGIAGAEIGLTITPKATDSATYSYDVAVTNGSYNNGKVTVAGTGAVAVTVTFARSELEVNAEPKLEINGYHTSTDYSARFNEIKKNILNAVLKNSYTNIDDYNLHIWMDIVGTEAKYYNYDDNSGLLCDYNTIMASPYRFPCADFGDTVFSTNLKVKIIDKQGRTVESTIAVTEAREEPAISISSAASGKYDTLDLFKEAVTETINVTYTDSNNQTQNIDKTACGLDVVLTLVEGTTNQYSVKAKATKAGDNWLASENYTELGNVVWTISQYTVKFVVKGEEQTAYTKTVDYNTSVAVPAVADYQTESTDYTFADWERSNTAADELAKEATSVAAKADVTYTAVFTESVRQYEYTIETYTMGTDGKYGEPEVETKTVDYGTEVSVSPEDKTGFTMDTGASVLSATVDEEGVKLKVYYIRNQYKISLYNYDGLPIEFPMDDGSTFEGELTLYYGANIADAIKAYEPARAGFTFAGWAVHENTGYEKPDWNGMVVDLTGATVTGDDAYIAVYTRNSYTITWMVDGEKYAVDTYAYEESVTAQAPEKTGYTFSGWDAEVPATMPAENLTFSGSFSINSYTITYKDTDGTVLHEETYEYNMAVTEYKPSKEGYAFGGWVEGTAATVMPAKNLTYTVKEWVANAHEITWVVDGVTVDTTTAKYGETVALIAAPDKFGYDFAGWDVNGTVYTEGWTMGDTNVTATATWTECVAAVGEEDYVSIVDAATAIKNGTVTGTTIELLADAPVYTRFLTEYNLGGKAVTIDGNGYRLYAATPWGTGNGKHLINVNSDNVTLKDIVLDCNNIAEGVNVYKAQNITFDNVTIVNKKGGNADLTVNGSTLNVKTQLTASYVDVSLGSGVTTPLGITADAGAILNVKTLQIASAGYPNTNLDGALAADNTSYYTFKKLDASGALAGYANSISRLSNGYTWQLLENASVSSSVTLLKNGNAGILDLNGFNLTIADGYELKVGDNTNALTDGYLTVKGEGTVTGNIALWSAYSSVTGSADLPVIVPADMAGMGYKVVYTDGAHYFGTTVTWVNGDETTTEDYVYGRKPVAPTATKAGDAQYTHTFAGWNDGTNTYAADELPAVEAPVTYTATYSSTVNSYTVTWSVDGNTTTETYEYGVVPSFKGSTDKATANYVKYTFTGWSPAIEAVTGAVTYTAQYSAELLAVSGGTVEINGYYDKGVTGDNKMFETLKADVLNAAKLPGDKASEYTVTMKYAAGGLNLDELPGFMNFNAGLFFTAIETLPENRQFTITQTASNLSQTVTLTLADSRDPVGLKDYAESADLVKEYDSQDDLTAYVETLANDKTKVNPNGVAVTVTPVTTWPATAGVATKMTYTVSYEDSADYIGGSATITVWAKAKHNNCTVVADSTLTAGGSLTVSPSTDNTTVAGNDTVTITVTPSGSNVVETITVTKNGKAFATYTTDKISYSNKAATVSFKSDGSVKADVYTVSVVYSQNYLDLKADQTIVYCVDDKNHTYDLQKLVFDAIFGGSSAPMTKDNVTLEYAYGSILGYDRWADVSKDPSINIPGYSHKFGESGSETIKLTYSDAKYGSFEQQIALNVFDSCYNVTVGVTTVTNGANATIKTQYSEDARKYLGVDYFKQGTGLTVTLTPDGEFLDTLKQMYNGTYADAMAYIQSVTVYDKAGDVVEATLTRDQGKLSLEGILQGVNPMLYNAAVTFNLAADEAYTVTVEYGILKLDAKNSGFQMEMYKGGKDYAAKVPSAQDLINAILGEAEAAAFLATYGGAFTVDFSTDLINYKWTAVSDEALLALNDGTEIKVRITWKPTDGDKTYYPVADTANVTLVDLRTPTSVAGEVPTEQVNFSSEDELIADLKKDMGLGILAGDTAIDVDYTVNYTPTETIYEVDEEGNVVTDENGEKVVDYYLYDVIVSYNGSAAYKPTSKTFNKVPVANQPDNATIKVTIQNASDVITDNAGKIKSLDPATGIYTVIGNGTYNFKFTPVSGKAIESVTVNGTAVELTYAKGVATFSMVLAENEHYEVVVETVNSAWELHDERVYDFAYGVMDPVNADIVDAAAEAPTADDIDYKNVSIEYMAREEGTVSVTLPDIDLGFTVVELGSFDVELGELWLNPEKKVEAVSENQLDKILDNLVEDVIAKVSQGELSANNALAYIQDYIKSLPLGIHAFGEAGDGSTETIRMSYADDKYSLAEVVTDVTIHDYRIATELSASDCSVTFGYSLSDLIAASGAAVLADGAATGLAVQSNGLYLHANTEAQQVTLYFAGDATYQPCETTINVIVNKADCDIDYDSQIITYGDEYDLALSVSPTVMPDGTNAEIDRVEFMIGLDMHSLLDVDIEDKTVGIDEAIAYVQLRLPETIRELPLVGEYLQGEFTLGEFTDLINGLSDVLGIDEGSMGILNEVVSAITGITDNMEIKIIVKDEDFHPTNIGVYIAGAVTVDADFNTAYTADYLIIKPKTIEATLAWDYTDDNQILTLPAFQEIYKDLLGAHVVENEVMTGDMLDTANGHVKYLILGVSDETSEFLTTDIYGNIKANIWTSPDQITDNGAYVQIAYMLNWGNEIYYAVPIVRSFLIVPQTADVQLLGDNGEDNNDLLKTYNGQGQGFNVKVLNAAGEELANTWKGIDSEWLTVTYVGVQTNGKTYNDTALPEHAGVYSAVATYVEYDEDGNLLRAGADMGVMVIEPSESSITVDNDVHVWDNTAYDLESLITEVDSLNSDKTPDVTVITAQVATDGSFSENGWEAIEGKVNVDFPKWVDELIAEYAPSVVDGITVAELQEKLFSKLPSFEEELAAIGASEEVVNSLGNLVSNLTEALSTLPGDTVLSFKDDVQASAVGVYVVMGVVTDSDHYPSSDYGILVITPDATKVELKYEEDPNGNNIYTPELLKVMDLGAKAYDPATGEEISAASALVVNVFVGVDVNGNTVTTTDPSTLNNGIYTEFSYILDIDSEMYYAEPISRPVILVANPATVNFLDVNGNVNPDQIRTFDNEEQVMDVEVLVNGNAVTVEDGDLTVRYVGVQTNGKQYNSTTAPTHAGVYVVTAVYNDYDEDGQLVSFGAAVGALAIEPADSTIDVTGGNVPYDGQEHTADVVATGVAATADYTLISGGAWVTGDIDEIGVDAFHGNVNIDFPRWLDEALAEHEFKTEGVDTAYLIDFIDSYRDDLVAAIPVDELVALEVVTEDEINAYIEKLDAYIDELLAVLDKLPKDVALTFDNGVGYTEPGYYFFYGIVTDSDLYPSSDTGLLVIEKADMVFDLKDTVVPYNGQEQWNDTVNEVGADYLALVIDRDNNTINFILDQDAQYLLNSLMRILDEDFDGDVQLSTIINQYSGEELADAIVKLATELEALDLTADEKAVLAAVKAELENLPDNGTITVNGALPVDAGEYEVYALSYSQYYKTSATEGILTIEPIRVVVDDIENGKVYGEADPELTANVSYYYLKDGEKVAVEELSEDIQLTYDVVRVAGEDVGTYAMSVENASIIDSRNYILEVVEDDTVFTISQAAITLTPVAASKTYGKADPDLTYEYEVTAGVVSAEEIANVLKPVVSREAGENVGTYGMTITYTPSNNYVVTVNENVGFGILKAKASIVAEDQTKIYGEADPTLAATVNGAVNGETLNYSLARKDGENVGEYDIIVTLGENPNYEVSATNGKLTITKKVATVTAKDASKVYGETDPALTAEVTGLVGEDTLNYSLARKDGENVGEYDITVTLGENPNYEVSVTNGKLTITKASATVTAKDASKVYGETDPALTATVEGLVGEDTLNYTVARAAGEDVGTYTITVTLGENPNYEVSVTNGTFTINKAKVTVTADDVTVTYGAKEPELTYKVDVATGAVVDGLNVRIYREPTSDNVGTYTIYVEDALGKTNPNYDITYVNGAFTITSAAVTVKANDASKVYGETDPALTATVTGMMYGEKLTVTCGRVAGENVGTYAITPAVTADEISKNYSITIETGTLTITAKEIAYTVPGESITYGDTYEPKTYEVDGVNGEKVSVTTALTGEYTNVGTYEGAITASIADGNYKLSVTNGDLTITKAEASVAEAPEANELTYDGEAQELVTDGTANGGTMVYSLDGETWSEEVPSATNADTYTVYYKVVGDSNHNDTAISEVAVTIAPKAITIEVADAGITYGETYEPVNGTVDEVAYTTVLVEGTDTNVGTYEDAITATYEANSNYAVTVTNGTLTITAKEITAADVALDGTLTYNGNEQTQKVTVTDGITYGVTGNTGTNVKTDGDYTLTVTGTGNYTGTVELPWNIVPKPITITADNKSKTVGEETDPELTYTADGLAPGDSLSGITLEREEGEEPGTYAIKVSVDATKNPNYSITPAEGVFTIELGDYVCWNMQTGVYYTDLSDALIDVDDMNSVTRAATIETIQMLKDYAEYYFMVAEGTTLDLNGFTVTANYVAATNGADIIDSQEGAGQLVVGMNLLTLDEGNAMLPVWTGSSYIFVSTLFAIRENKGYTGEGFYINALPAPGMRVVELFKDGASDNNIQIAIRLSWDTDEGVKTQDFTFRDDVVADVYSSNKGAQTNYGLMFKMIVTGIDSVQNLRANVLYISGTDAEIINSTPLQIN